MAAVQLPNSDTVTQVAEDAFPDTEGLTIIIPENLTKLDVFHFNLYNNLIFQTVEDLPDDSPVIRYLEENGLSYKKGKDGELIEPEVTPNQPTASPQPEVTPDQPTDSPIPEVTPNQPTDSPQPEVTPEQPSPTPADSTIILNVTQTVDTTVLSGSEPNPVSQNTQDTTSDKSIYTVGKLEYEISGKNQVTVIGMADSKQKSITIPETVQIQDRLHKVTRIGKRAFYGQGQLRKVKVGNYVKKIETEAFAQCSELVHIQFGTGLVEIGGKALYQDKKMKTIIFKGTKLKKIGKKTFYGISLKKVSVKVKKSRLLLYKRLILQAK